jgi:DNA replication factor GINS
LADGINVTYDTLFEVLLKEKNRAELQKLEADFFSNIADYLKEKKAALSKERLDVFSEEEKEKTEKQIRNIHKILKELYERREKKLLDLAMIKARSSSAAIDTAAMLAEEKRVFDELTNLLSSYRENTLTKVINGQLPQRQKGEAEKAKPAETEKPKAEKVVRFIHEVPKFLGKELEVYGPFNADDTATLPAEIADILITKGRAEEIGE